jgi:hypothetical protein
MRTRALVGLMLLGCGAIAAAPAPARAAPAVSRPVPPNTAPAGSAGSSATPDPTTTTTASTTTSADPTSAGSATASADPSSSSSTLAASDGAAGVARRALARLDVQVSGIPRVFETVLPAQLTDANHGVKAAACRGGGYDLDAVAGRAVTFVGYDTTCSHGPRIAWAVVRGDAVACVYLSCTERDSAAPGIWPATRCRE